MKQFIDPNLLDRLRVGPLAAYLDTYLKRIEHAGFLPSSAPIQMYAIARFSNWLHSRQVNLRLMDEGTIQQFLKRDLDIAHGGESASLHRLLTMLREIGVTAPKPVQVKACQKQLADEYEHYLLHERGLAQSSVLNYVPFAEQFLTHRVGRSEMTISSLTARDVTKFIQDRVRQLSPDLPSCW
jgi:hypothetical protein